MIFVYIVVDTISVAHLRSIDDPDKTLEFGNLQTLLDVANTPDSKLVLNLLDCPMGGVTVQAPPRYDAFASDEWAATMTKGMPFIGTANVTDDVAWGTAGLKYASSWPHLDDEGFCTVVTVKVGGKWWLLARKKRQGPTAGGIKGDIGTVHSFDGSWQPYQANSDIFEHEAIFLTPGCVL